MSDDPRGDDVGLDLRSVIDALPRAIIVITPDRRILLWNRQAEQLYGWAADEVLGREVTEFLVAPSEQEEAAAIVSEVTAGGVWSGDFNVLRKDGTPLLIWVHNQPVVDGQGNVVAIVGASEDVTELRRMEGRNAELSEELRLAAEEDRIHRDRLEVLSAINDVLAASDTPAEIMANVAHAAVPALADWCSVYLLADGPIPEVAIANADPDKVAYARSLRELNPYDPDAPTGIPKVIRTGEPDFFPIIDDAVLTEIGASEELRQVVADLGLHSGIQVPLRKRERVIGALQVVMTGSRRSYTDEDFSFVQAIAARVASTLENRRLAHQQREIAFALQASLLPDELPEIPGIEMAVRYWANGEAVEVGGDFYDAFPIHEDTWGLVIGDVCGTGPTAAATTGLARHTIAASAWHGDDHRTVLQNLNRTLHRRNPNTFCTALYATIRTGQGSATLEFASAGHPLPVFVSATGDVGTVGAPGQLAGVFEHIDVTVTSLPVDPGDTVVLYTDGATDVAPPHGLNPTQLQALVREAAAAAPDPEQIADRLDEMLSSILPIADRRDDIAILVLCAT